ncbi:MAG: DUF4193 family protein [Acidimicrobiia bacterium]
MSDDEFDDEAELEIDDDEELGDDDLADDDEDARGDDDGLGDEADLLDVDVDLSTEVPVAVITDDTATTVVPTEDEDDEEGVVDLDEELHPDDVEEPLDVLLQERTASATLEDDEEEVEDDEGDADGIVDGPARIVPRRADEFLCKSCFLVLPLRRLADEERQFCDDCA